MADSNDNDMTKELRAVIQLITNALQYKNAADGDVEFYWDSLLKPDLSEQGLLWAVTELGKSGVIQRKKLQYEEEKPQSTRSRLLYATRTHPRAVWTYSIDRQRLERFLESAKPKYLVCLTKTREVIVNDKYIVGKPNFASENHDFILFAIEHPNTTITREALRAAKLDIAKKFAQIIADLGFKGELKRAFFPNASIKAVEFRNSLTDADLKELQVDEVKLRQQLNALPKTESKDKKRNAGARKTLN
ncbi:hypothetical protein A3A21_00050 [Candidatus Jorgensenbacteria bacterium RIFCSPLOWO2_01_FULL_45_25b]|uniref:Uncharacterized protein n=1 Tax=Candidatus Jorgensenbacteria bacterium RIFCSPLOWO2_01_FULL_45_25b TaxID=1798471 RepID=A0A1F6BRX1_9BACT|nr:MAG: hypothetical protein A3A21_00050 [Candidatus Jorgensenbacteria bacterium RIFCSPLOWO2_01_FULL_45_25b]